MKRIFLLSILVILINISAEAQALRGVVLGVTDNKTEPLQMATVYWLKTQIVTNTDEKGIFEIVYPDSLPSLLVIRYLGFHSDTLLINEQRKDALTIKLKSSINLKEVNIETRRSSTNISTINPINTEILSSKELQKAACCNLSESFETNASVDVNITDAVSGAKQIQMLGLDGTYTQILSENLPLIRGLSSSGGLNFIPGPWVESILITKGTGSVVNGYESITGQIQVELIEPEKAEKLYINGYGNPSNGRYEANIYSGKKINDKLSTLLLLHGSDVSRKIDNNKDLFLDNPLGRQINLMNRWHLSIPEKLEAQLVLKFLDDERKAGQLNFDYDRDFGKATLYGIGINTRQMEVFGKTGFLFPDKPFKSIGLMGSARVHEQNSFFGLRNYNGKQTSFYFNSIYQSIISDTRHKLKSGISFLNDNFSENFIDSTFSRTEIVPGVYGEYTYNDLEKISLVVGVRGDYHNLYGFIPSPRIHFKYCFNELTAFRLSGGRGFRVANVFVENTSIFASSRRIVFTQKLNPEVAWNYGGSFTKKFTLLKRESVFNVDFFHTRFENQVVVDLETADRIKFYNLAGKSYSNSFQSEFSFSPLPGVDLKVAYKWYDVKSTYSGILKQRPLIPTQRALANIGYITPLEKWKFDYTLKWFGKSRLPDVSSNPEAHHHSDSKSYYTMLAQITKVFRYFEVYLGGENLANYMQMNPIIDADNPFGNNFDASLIWGPVMGRTVYAGFRYSIK